MSPRSVGCVAKLSLFHGAEDTWEYSLSDTDEGDEGTIGADMKLLPRGVGKWSLIGENQFAFLDSSWARGVGKWSLIGESHFASLDSSCDSSIVATLLEVSSSSSIMVLSERRLLMTCTGDGGV
jgi:hypothetical protein